MSAQNRDLSTTVEKTLLFWRFWLDRDVGDSFSVWRDVFLCAIPADTHVGYLPPICQHTHFQSNVASESGYVSVLRSLCLSLFVCFCVCFYLRVCVCPLAWTHLCGDGTSPASHYALAQKVLPEHANTTAPGAVDGERRWVGGKGMCVYIMHMSHFPAFQQLYTPKVETRGMQAMPTWVS